MKLALIPPISFLPHTELTQYQLMLPHLVNDSRYTGWYAHLGADKNQFVILDNGEAEGENNLSASELLLMARSFNVDEVVAPDTMRDAEATMHRVEDFLDSKKRLGDSMHHWFNDLSVAVVAQGTTLDEVKKQVEYWMQHHQDEIDTICFPRHLLSTLSHSYARLDLAEWVEREYGTDRPNIHMLGANVHWPQELATLALEVGHIVRGMDTSIAWTLGAVNEFIGSSQGHIRGEMIVRPKDYFKQPMKTFHPTVADQNVHTMIRWVQDGRH